jgi:hypothetical protein
MKIYRFAIHPKEENEKYYCIECLNDPALYTQARSMDEVVMMARDVVAAMYEFDKKDILIELVIPPDVKTKYDTKPAKKTHRARKLTATH